MVSRSHDAVSLTQPSDREIVITRIFAAPRALVFKVWTDPKHIAAWWGPKGLSNSACEVDLRVGGVFRVELTAPDGGKYPCQGVFKEIVEPERIVYTGSPEGTDGCGAGLPPHATVTVTFVEKDGQTTLTIHTLLTSAAAVDAAVKTGFNTGWASSLERLAEYLEVSYNSLAGK